MGVQAANVLRGTPDQLTTGAILSAPLGTTLPQSASDDLDSTFDDSGYVNKDGVKVTPEYSTTDINDWSGAIVRRILESFSGTIEWSHLEWNERSLKNAFGDDNVTFTSATTDHGNQLTVAIGARERPRKAWVIRMKDGANRILIVVPDGQNVGGGEMNFVSNDAIQLPVSLACYPDEAGNSIYIYSDDGLLATA